MTAMTGDQAADVNLSGEESGQAADERLAGYRPAVGLAEALNGELVEMGSAGAKAMAIVQGKADIYAHGGGQYEWDSAAPVAVAAAAGCHTSRLDGSPLVYNNADPYLPDLVFCRTELAGRILAALASLA